MRDFWLHFALSLARRINSPGRSLQWHSILVILKSFLCQGALYAKKWPNSFQLTVCKIKPGNYLHHCFQRAPRCWKAVKSNFPSHRNHFLPLKWHAVGCVRGWPKEATWNSDNEWRDGKTVLSRHPAIRESQCQPGQWHGTDQRSKELPLQSSVLQ